MASRTYAVEVEDIPLGDLSTDGGSTSEGSVSPGAPLRCANTDVQVRELPDNSDSTKWHTCSGWEHHCLQHSLPSHHRGEVGGSHTLGRNCERGPSAWYNTVMAHRRQGVMPASEEEAVTEIAEAMEGDKKLMSDNLEGEIMRKETLRELTKPLRAKKELRRRLTDHHATLTRSTRNISPIKHLKYTISMYCHKMVGSVQDTFHDYSLWHKDLKEIEGKFGSGVGTYFRFLRYLFLLNLFITFIMCGFLLTPQLLAPLQPPAPTTSTPASSSASSAADGNSLIKAEALRVSYHPPSSNIGHVRTNTSTGASPSDIITSDTPAFGALDWLTGAGWFDSTALYYGNYPSQSFSLVQPLYYNIPEAYFLVILTSYVIYLLVILRRVTVLYKNNYIDTEHDVSATFVKKVFSSWDFSITEKKAATIKHRSIYSELKELLEEYLREDEEEGRWECVRGWCVRLVFWLVVLAVHGLLGWSTFLMLENGINRDIVSSDLGLLVYPLIVTCIITFVPPILALIVKLEPYKSPRHCLIVTLIRTFLLEMTVLGVLVGFWYTQASDLTTSITTTTTATSTIVPAKGAPLKLRIMGIQEDDDCWETSLGQEFYRLLIIDFLITLIMQLTTLIFSVATHKKTTGKLHQYLLEFDMSRNTLHLIYNQTLLWAAIFFCPLTPIIVLIKMFITFYIQKVMVLKFLRPNERPWRAAQTETVFFGLTLLSLLLAMFGYFFILVRGNTSSACGPFETYKHYIEFIWDLTASDEQTALKILSFFLKPGVVAGILGILMILVYCAKSMAEGRAEMIKVLRQQLELEMRDRAFLLQLTEKVRRGDHKPANPGQARVTSPQLSSSNSHHQNQPQRAASFVFSNNKVYPTDVQPRARHVSDYAGESQI